MPESTTGAAAEDKQTSAGEDQDVIAGVTSTPDPAGGKTDKPTSVLDAVTTALDDLKADKSKSESPTDDGKKGTEDAEAKADTAVAGGEDEGAAELTDEELKALSQRAQRRIRHLSKQVSDVASERDGFKANHEKFESVVSYMQQAGLTAEDVNTGFDVMRLMKGAGNGTIDPHDALAAIEPFVEQLKLLAGETIAPDLRQQVADGTISEAAAKELTKTRLAAETHKRAATVATETATAERTRQTVEQAVSAASNAATDWENTWAKSDPDYSRKASLVKDKVETALHRHIQANKRHPTAQETVAICTKARTEVEQALKGFLPKPTTIKTEPSGGGSSSARPKPRTALEAADIGIELARAAG